MNPSRIAELLDPFLSPGAVSSTGATSHLSNPCHSQERSDEEPAVPSPTLSPVNDHRLSASDLEHISTYIDLLLRWNSRVNLTAIRNPEEIVTRHFGESLFAARHLFPRALPGARPGDLQPLLPGALPAVLLRGRAALQGRGTNQEKSGALAPEGPSNAHRHPTLADLGSGAGFPGIPIKLWAPQISLTLIESNHKKATFLREITRALTLTDVDIQNIRAESLAGTKAGTKFDVVTLRAVERFESILPVAASLLTPTGHLALLISSSQIDSLAQLDAAHPTLSLAWSTPIPIPLSRSRVLLLAACSRR